MRRGHRDFEKPSLFVGVIAGVNVDMKTAAQAGVAVAGITGFPYVHASEKVTLRYLGTAVNQDKAIAEKFEADTGIKIQYIPVTTDDVTKRAVTAPNEAAAAEYFPAIYWYAMLKVPEANLFPGTGPNGNGMPERIRSQAQWLDVIKTNGCYTCHQLGNKATRTMPKMFSHYATSTEAWQRRIQSGQAMTSMATAIGRIDAPRALKHFADWTDRIAAGELPFAKPERPRGVERNVVITSWDWSEPTAYLHDSISTDKRNPTVNANGKIYGSPEESTDFAPVFDPKTHSRSSFVMPVRDPNTPSTKNNPMAPSPFWGDKPIWDSQTSMHNPMFDEKGRVWYTSRALRQLMRSYRAGEHSWAVWLGLAPASLIMLFWVAMIGGEILFHICYLFCY